MERYKVILIIPSAATIFILFLFIIYGVIDELSGIYIEYGGLLSALLTLAFIISIAINFIFLMSTILQGLYSHFFAKKAKQDANFLKRIQFVILLTLLLVGVTFGMSQLVNHLFGFSRIGGGPAIIKQIPE
jgi:hypothetical protein